MCCILRRGCRKETTQEGHKRYRFRSDWDKSGTMTSSETRITEAIPPNDNATTSTATGDKNNPGTTGVLVRIEEETAADSCAKTDGSSSPKNESSDTQMENGDTRIEENDCQMRNNRDCYSNDEELKLMDKHCQGGLNHAGEIDTTCTCITTHLSSKKKRESRKDKLTEFEEADSSNYSTGESFKELINDSDTAGLSEEE